MLIISQVAYFRSISARKHTRSWDKQANKVTYLIILASFSNFINTLLKTMKAENEKRIKLLHNKFNITTFIITFKNLKSYFICTQLLMYCLVKLPWISASSHLPSASIYVIYLHMNFSCKLRWFSPAESYFWAFVNFSWGYLFILSSSCLLFW